MNVEENLAKSLVRKFGFLENKIRVKRPRRIEADVDMSNFKDLFDHAVREQGFEILCTITGLDEQTSIGLIYHLARLNGIMLNIKTSVPKDNPVVETITSYFPAADIYEREMMDLLGVRVEGLAEGKRYPLPDDWPIGDFPLRKDWKPADKKVGDK